MIDLFLRWWPQSLLRYHMAHAVRERLLLFKDAALHTVHNRWGDRFHIESKRWAEEHAQSDIYCVIDDDHLPIGPDWLRVGYEALGNHPEYGMLTTRLLIEHGHLPLQPDVLELHAIGCPYFVRRGTLTFPDGAKEQYDGILSKVVTDRGLKTGVANRCLTNHLGHGFSQVVPEHWRA